jgi:hypothetical protein
MIKNILKHIWLFLYAPVILCAVVGVLCGLITILIAGPWYTLPGLLFLVVGICGYLGAMDTDFFKR